MKILGLATCFNRKEKTVSALKSIIEGNPSLDFSFIITDDASTDGTASALSQFENVTVVSGNGNSFYTGGMRLAIAKAFEKYVSLSKEEALNHEDSFYPDYALLFNDDVEFVSGAIEDLVSRFTADNQVWVGPAAENDGKTLAYGGVVRKSNFKPKFWIVDALGRTASDKIGEESVSAEVIGSRKGLLTWSDERVACKVDTFNANCVLIPWDLFIKTGNMDKVYNHSLGDFDYGYMLRRKGAELYVSDRFVGICPNNSIEGGWRDPKLSRKERFRKKESIKGVPFKEFFHYLLKNYNLLTAVIYSFSPYIRIMIGK